MTGVSPGIVGAPASGSVDPPFALNQLKTAVTASAVGVTGPFALIEGPRYTNRKVCGLPAADPESAILFEIPDTYFAKLPEIDQAPEPVGSQTTPTRGLRALSLATSRPALSSP